MIEQILACAGIEDPTLEDILWAAEEAELLFSEGENNDYEE